MKGNNKFSDFIKEYARKLTDDDLRFLNVRLLQRIGSDVAEATELLQCNSEVDHWFSLGRNATDFYEMLDIVDISLQNEAKRRFSLHEAKKERIKE